MLPEEELLSGYYHTFNFIKMWFYLYCKSTISDLVQVFINEQMFKASTKDSLTLMVHFDLNL